MMGKDIHDGTFKQLMSDKEFFVGFCQNYLPKEVLSLLDLKTADLFQVSGEKVHASIDQNKNYKKEIADILYTVRMQDQSKGMIFVHCEHFSTSEPNTILRMANYALNALVEYNEMHKQKPLPTLIPIVYYHGEKAFVHTLNLYELFERPDLAQKYLFNPKLIDLSQYSDEELATHAPISAAEIVFRHTLRKQDMEERTQMLIIEGFQQLTDNARVVVLKYALKRLELNDERFIERYIDSIPEDGDTVMTIAEQLMQRGREEGMQKGVEKGILQGVEKGVMTEKEETAKKMLFKGLGFETIAEITELSVQKIQAIKVSISH